MNQSIASDGPELEFTGERFTPECVREIFYEHWHRYAWAGPLVSGRRVLDAACGEGYGSALLAEFAGRVDGVDLDAGSIAHARERYRRENLEFHRANVLELPFPDDSFDAVVSFETLEHLAEHDVLMAEFRRVLRPDGFLLISSPDRRTYSDETGYVNEFHVRELYRPELEALLQRHFPAWRLCGQKLAFHSLIWPLQETADSSTTEHLMAGDKGGIERGPDPELAPVYFLAMAAAAEDHLPGTGGLSLFTDRSESVYSHYNQEVGKHIRAGELLAEREAEIARLRQTAGGGWRRWLRLLIGRR